MLDKMIPTPYYLAFANTTSARDMRELDPSGRRRFAIGITSGVGGTCRVRPPGGASDGSDDQTLTLAAGEDRWIEFSAMPAFGTATGVVIYWAR